MGKQITSGQEVTLRSALGIITRTVVGICGDVVAVCTSEEYRQAKHEVRQPLVVGFKLADIVEEG